MYAALSTLAHVYDSTVMVILRKHLSQLPLMQLRSRVLRLFELITDLSSLDHCSSVIGTPLKMALRFAVLDLLYGSCRRRPGNLL